MWEKINIIMTDNIEKNLHIENGIVAARGFSHIPLHLLCEAQTVEAVKYGEALESINPGLKSFL